MFYSVLYTHTNDILSLHIICRFGKYTTVKPTPPWHTQFCKTKEKVPIRSFVTKRVWTNLGDVLSKQPCGRQRAQQGVQLKQSGQGSQVLELKVKPSHFMEFVYVYLFTVKYLLFVGIYFRGFTSETYLRKLIFVYLSRVKLKKL